MTQFTPSDDRVLEAMTRYGGSFAVALAEACRRADPRNFLTIKSAFADLFAEYEELAALKQQNWTRR